MSDANTTLIFQGNNLVVPEGPNAGIIDEDKGDCFTIPSVDGSDDISAIMLKNSVPLPPEWKSVPLRQALDSMTGGVMADGVGQVGRMLRAYHIALWRQDSRFCGTCGNPNKDAETGELARQCPACGRLEFPRISPAVITIIVNDKGEALLAHNKKFVGGVYSLIAGFNEAGESLEATVARETKEEVNIDVTGIRYVRSQPWPFPNSLMLGFTARYAGGEIKPDGVEIEDARWFSREKLPPLPGNGSVSRYLIGLWLDGAL
ncbi:NAD(+) diphosphatase [Leadbettera azotonutricia]|uniref:NAD(+) diphosphatase n=1 Tax=Leadbettera azotonutricia (strain ATCC BAA-888 / DSM 13862 / ZAS-9) TaxID=545695 RepID=F5YEZ2_LEAAZ|nr:NAD(+) diphosphatase [Leadbettera azotonutricia]AEF83154.1 NAD(+) diphosphatase [Leadbettera azotonutricia ZAS-9]